MDILRSTYNHLVVPPQLPGGQDSDIEAVSHDVLKRLIGACESVNKLAAPPWSEAFQSLHKSLNVCLDLNNGHLEKMSMLEYFRQLQLHDTLILYVVEQNAAVIIRRETSDGQHHVIFEAFEASPTSEEVLASPRALQWDFPGYSAQLPLSRFNDGQFQESLALFLEQASMESLHGLQAHTRKAKVSVTEVRDTTDPALITQMLLPLLAAVGSSFQAPVLRKRIRDEVNINDADLPWRRLPFWLVLRVAAQRQLCLALGNEQGRAAYKSLICIVLTDLLKESTGKLDPDLTIRLRAKLCRRMAKLEMDSSKLSQNDANNFETLFSRIGPMIESVTQESTAHVEAAWESFKQTMTRAVPKLPSRSPAPSLQLSLRNSGAYLDGLLSNEYTPQANPRGLDLPQPFDKAIKQTQDFTDRLSSLAAMEEQILRNEQPDLDTASDCEEWCIQLAGQIDEVFDSVGAIYDSQPEQISAMILTIFVLWVRLDQCAVLACPLLSDHRPVFEPELLNVLQLSTMASMHRLERIQTYLAQRHSSCRYGTILDRIDMDCVAVRYVTQSAAMQSLGSRIQRASNHARDAKEAEWKRSCDEYDEHTARISDYTCRCSWSEGERDVRGCTKCWHRRVRNRLKIEVQEALLPEKDPARAALLFELAIPSYLSAYRNVTWRILRVLAYPSRPVQSSKSEIELRHCAPLQPYMTARARSVSLASTIKCFTQTHYKFNSGRVPLSSVLLPLAARFELYDHISGLWIRDLNKPLTFQHLCGVSIPRGLEATIMPAKPHPPRQLQGPSSYELQANQTECPSHMSIHEFSAYQKLLTGDTRRWPNIIVEMGSSNLNFSSSDTTRMLCQIAIQAGPQLRGEVLRASHVIFREPTFLDRLAEVIEQRLDVILMNWREYNCMELLVTLSLRLYSLSSGASRVRAKTLLYTARDATLGWVARLREELRGAKDADTAQRTATYGFCAALVCRQTFAMFVELDQALSAKDLASWIQASVALQENLLSDIDQLPQPIKAMLIRDAKMGYHLRSALKKAIHTHPSGVGDGIIRCWTKSPDGTMMTFSPWNFMSPPNDRWITATVSEGQGRSSSIQRVHYNIVEGHLLMNGKLRGKLPLQIRDDPTVKVIFGKQHLLTYPSSLSCCSHRLATNIQGQEVHFGLRGDQVVIRARKKNQLLEFIPKSIFMGPNHFDLPAELVDNCVHWLNLSTGCLEIRRVPEIWSKRPRDWEVDIPARLASRGNVNLVDPRSNVFSRISGILRHFERPEKLTVYQPKAVAGRLTVELRYLELSFYVNSNGLLECRQFKAEIDPNQEFGSWHGLQSKLVLRNIVTGERSVIVPLAGMKSRRQGIHVEVRTNDANDYGRYKIDDVLGQLSCPPEPRLLYMKALCHAMTSFCLPDTLTSQTGYEEAFSILRSGAAQPWIPLGGVVHPIIKALGSLVPRREYYPTQVKRLQKVIWDNTSTPTIQHDGYESAIRDIMQTSNRLGRFSSIAIDNFDIIEQTHLRQRGTIHRQLHERPTANILNQDVQDSIYVPRDRRATSKAARVDEIVRLVLARCSSICINATLQSVLESWQTIGGFHSESSFSPDRGALISQIEDPIHEHWGDLVNFCRLADSGASLLFRLGLLAFGPDHDMDAIRSFAAFASVDELKNLQPPNCGYFVDFRTRGSPSLLLLEQLIVPARHAFKPRNRLGTRASRDSAGRDAEVHQIQCEEEGKRLARHLLRQWPTPADTLSAGDLVLEVIDIRLALENIHPEWTRRLENKDLEDYVGKVQAVLDSRRGSPVTSAVSHWRDTGPAFLGTGHWQVIPFLAKHLLLKPGPPIEDLATSIMSARSNMVVSDRTYRSPPRDLPAEFTELRSILNSFTDSADTLRREYGADLLESLAALENDDQILRRDPELLVPTLESVTSAIEQARRALKLYRERISTALAANDKRSIWLQIGVIWPCMSPTAVLESLSSRLAYDFGPGMKAALVSYGLAITNIQQLMRIRNALLQQDKRVLDEELQNPGHENWEPIQLSDWLLMEIDGDFLIRARQADVAKAIIKPASGENSVLQMNMGQGKTSCIVPMVVAVLADGHDLSRLIVPRALLMQTAQTVQSRLGGLVGRRVCHVPFSRRTATTSRMLELYAELHRETCGSWGLMLTSHEHILSYKLGGWQRLADGELQAANDMIGLQIWLDDHCRDVLDECDFTLSVKTQLNYPSGTEMAVDGHPFRWQVAQGLLELAAYHIPTLKGRFPNSIEVLGRSSSFPVVHFLKTDAEKALHNHILDDVCAGHATFLRPKKQTHSKGQEAIRQALSEQKFDEGVLARASRVFTNPQTASKMLLTIRGLLQNKILLLCLDKRWNVQYGLHPDRHPVAVPFDAKGTPSEQAEFSHPDVAILFTCLAFYYTGLNMQQFRQGLQHVLQSDNPTGQYELWISGCKDLPGALRHWNAINIDDCGQVEELWQRLRLDLVVINQFLNYFVFPAHARQFEVKLQASAWDVIPLVRERQNKATTTGFSGTNDNRKLLPLTIRQDDLPSLRQTNAEVLSYLLQSRNREYQVIADGQGRRLTEAGLLRMLDTQGIRLLIDAGAYILEMSNKTLVKTWMSIDTKAKAAVYFGGDNRAWVHFRSETKSDVPLLASPFADNLSECVVYLDEAHTRGVDLKLPSHARGALTLALKQTKDFTVQAAMRLRQLRTTQSVTFLAPPEVDRSIRDFCCPTSRKQLNSAHVVSWLLEQTCRTNEDLQGLHIMQGIDFVRRADATWRHYDFLSNRTHRKRLLNVLQQAEHHTLEQMYGQASNSSSIVPVEPMCTDRLQTFVGQLTKSSGGSDVVLTNALAEVEQEREIQAEVEQVREVQKPPRKKALRFPGLHPTISEFVRTGSLNTALSGHDRSGFEHAFACVAKTAIGKKFGVRETDSNLFVSTEFGRTIKDDNEKGLADNYLRSVEWILWSPTTQTALVVIPEEAESIISAIRLAADQSPVHLIAYAAPITTNMLPFNSLQYYTLPPFPTDYHFPEWFHIELGILAGRMYIDSSERESLANYLRPSSLEAERPSGSNTAQRVSDEVDPARFANDTAAFLLEWLPLRRHARDVLHTPVGQICLGREPRD